MGNGNAGITHRFENGSGGVLFMMLLVARKIVSIGRGLIALY